MSYIRLTRDFYQAVEALMEGKVEEKLDPQASEGGGSHPKTDRHQELAAMGHPKDKITRKDVLIARGVVAKEEAEVNETSDNLRLNVAINRADKQNQNPTALGAKKMQQNVNRLKPTQHADYLRGGPKSTIKSPYSESVELEEAKRTPKYASTDRKIAGGSGKGKHFNDATTADHTSALKFHMNQAEMEGHRQNDEGWTKHTTMAKQHLNAMKTMKEGKETDDMMVKSFKPEVVKALDKRGVTKHPPYRNPGPEKLAAQKKAMKEDAEEQFDELQENISNKHKVGDVYQMDLVDHIEKKTGTKVWFDDTAMVHQATGKTIMHVKAHHTVGDVISAVKNLKEEAEELDEVIRNDPLLMKVGPIRSRDNTTGRSSPEEQQQGKENLKRVVKTSIDRMKTDRKPRLPEEVEEEVDQIITENNSFEIEVPARLTYKDYLDAAMQFVDAEDALTVAEAFYNEQDESLVIESFVRSDIEQKVAVHQKAGNQVSMPKFGTKDGKPYAEYVVTNKDDGIRRKYIHHGTMRRVENMGARGKKDAD